jgi:hypothetical protein
MAITQDGSQAFGISTPTFSGFIVENFQRTSNSNRVDLDDGNGEPLGSVTVPKRVEGSLTVQVGTGNTTPTIGAQISYGSDTFIVTEVGEVEQQEDYQRLNLSVYKKINV